MRMKEVKMSETARGSEDGFTVSTYEKGRTYMMGEDLAKVFISQMKVAKAAPKAKAKAAPKAKADEKSNKAVKPETPESPKA